MKLSKNIASLSTGLVTSYALYILIGLILYILIINLAPTGLNLVLLLIILIFSLTNTEHASVNPKYTHSSSFKQGDFSAQVTDQYKISVRNERGNSKL